MGTPSVALLAVQPESHRVSTDVVVRRKMSRSERGRHSFRADDGRRRGATSPDIPSPDIPPATALHKLVMSLAVVLPLAGCFVAAALLWRWGFMGWLYVALLVGGWLLTGTGI